MSDGGRTTEPAQPGVCGPATLADDGPLRGLRLLMVAHANSAHTARWARYFQDVQGMVVRVISPVDSPIPGIETIPFPRARHWYHRLKGLHLYLDHSQWRRLAHGFHPDITHVHYPDGGGRNRFYFKGLPRIVTSTWGSDVVESPEFPLPATHKLGVRRMLAQSQVVTATTHFLARTTAQYCSPGTPIHIIPFGVDLDVFKPATVPSSSEEPTVGFFKNLERKYGPEILIEAFSLVLKQVPNARLVMCGKGDMAAALIRQVETLALSAMVEFPGRLPQDQVVRMMQRMDVVAMPSTCQESFGVAAVEASACEVPVVATRVGGVPEAVVDGQTGILVPPYDADALAAALVALLSDPARRARMGAAGREFVARNYQWHSNAATMALVYRQLMTGTPVKTPTMIRAGISDEMTGTPSATHVVNIKDDNGLQRTA